MNICLYVYIYILSNEIKWHHDNSIYQKFSTELIHGEHSAAATMTFAIHGSNILRLLPLWFFGSKRHDTDTYCGWRKYTPPSRRWRTKHIQAEN